MAYVRVVYKEGKSVFDYVSGEGLDTLIMRDKITHFYRPAEKRWVNIKVDPVRRSGGLYQGPERRGIIHRPDKEVQETGRDKRDRSSNWLNILWRHIGNI
jgi:hypothetical protein